MTPFESVHGSKPQIFLNWPFLLNSRILQTSGNDSNINLRKEATQYNPAALIVLAENYLNSDNPSEVNEGFNMLAEAK